MFRSLILPKAGKSLQRSIPVAAASTGAINFRTNNIIEFCSSSASSATTIISCASSTTCMFKPCGILFQQQPSTLSLVCPLCQRQFKSQTGLSDHILAKHGEDLKKVQQQKLNQQPNDDNATATPVSTPTIPNPPPPPASPTLPNIEDPLAPPATAEGAAAANTADPLTTSLFKCEHCNRTFKSREAGISHIKDKHKDLLSRAHQAYKEQLVATDSKKENNTVATSCEEEKPASTQ